MTPGRIYGVAVVSSMWFCVAMALVIWDLPMGFLGLILPPLSASTQYQILYNIYLIAGMMSMQRIFMVELFFTGQHGTEINSFMTFYANTVHTLMPEI